MIRDILARCYNDLPNSSTKSCFLYLAVFPEDYSISASDLIELRIAEGFIQCTSKHREEEIARKYINELYQRSLVQVVRESKAHGWIEKIKIHDILYDWCMEEARYVGFVDVIDDAAGQASSLLLCVYR